MIKMQAIIKLLDESPKKKKIKTGDLDTFISTLNNFFNGKAKVPSSNES